MVHSQCLVKIVPGERFTPYGLAQQIGARVILESSSFQKGRERYSVLLVREAFQLRQYGGEVDFLSGDGKKRYRVKSRARDILDLCRYFADQHGPVHQDFPFPAGGVGYLSFEFARFCDTIKFSQRPDAIGLPDAAFVFGHSFIVFDHYTDKLILIGFNYREAIIDLQDELGDLESMLLAGPAAQAAGQGKPASATRIDAESDSNEEYMRRVEEVRREVIAGNLLQGVPSRRLTLRSDIDPLESYRYLRSNNPSPYLFLIDFKDHQLFGASPEVHVKVRDGKVGLRPIAGTRRRGGTDEEDKALEQELLADPKERAEHLMLVDLGRNDLGRVCAPGTVAVKDYMVIERYSHVMHIVSQVEGELAAGKSGIDALRATFPAGTVSGAPKIRAIEIISRIETWQRRFYAGAIGYIEPGGNLDTCIGIRCAVKVGDRLVLQSGGGVVYDSTPERELEETREKMGAVLRAVGVDPGSLADQPAGGAEADTTYAVGYSGAGGAVEIQSRIDNLIDEKEYADAVAGEPSAELSLPVDPESDPWAEADAEAASLSASNRPAPAPGAPAAPMVEAGAAGGTAAEPAPWAEADAEAEALSGGGDGIVPLDWDFDPAAGGGTDDIQNEIDSLIGAIPREKAEGDAQ